MRKSHSNSEIPKTQNSNNNGEKVSLLKRAIAVGSIGAMGLGLVACSDNTVEGSPVGTGVVSSETNPNQASTNAIDQSTGTVEIESTETANSGVFIPGHLTGPDAEYDEDAFNKMDLNLVDLVKFKPETLDNSSPKALLASFQNDLNCIINESEDRINVVKECIYRLTGFNVDESDDINTQNLFSLFKYTLHARTAVSSYKSKLDMSLGEYEVMPNGDTRLHFFQQADDSLKNSSESNRIITFHTDEAGKTLLSTEPQIKAADGF